MYDDAVAERELKLERENMFFILFNFRENFLCTSQVNIINNKENRYNTSKKICKERSVWSEVL